MIEDLKGVETWRIFRIMSEFVEGFEELSNIGPAVTIFGSVGLNIVLPKEQKPNPF